MRALLLTLAAALALLPAGGQLFAHRTPPFRPDWAREDIAALLDGAPLSPEGYERLFRQTGLGRAGVDQLLAGEGGAERILAVQEDFFSAPRVVCAPVALFTREDHREGAPPSVPLRPGDVLLTFSTHTLGWRHGHAGLAVDGGATAEAVLVGTDSALAGADHWGDYATLVHLRLRGVTPEDQARIADFARTRLVGVPYRLTSGLFGPKAGGEAAAGAQCAWLVWRALWEAGYDADGDGGRLVTVADLAASPLFEVVQVRGLDPGRLPNGPF